MRSSFNSRLFSVQPINEIGKINHSLKAKPEIAIFGSSTAYMNIDPQVVNSLTGKTVFNFGLSGAAFDQLWHLHQFVSTNPETEIILLINPYELEKYDYKLNEEELFQHVLGYEEIYTRFQENSKWRAFFMRYFGWNNIFNLNAKHYNMIWNPTIDAKNFQLGYYNRNKNFSEGNNLYPTSTFNPQENQMLKFSKFLQSIQHHNKITLVLPPIVSKVDFGSLMEQFKNFKWIDLSNTIELQDTSYFQDYIHLNKRGAEKFSEILSTTWQELNH